MVSCLLFVAVLLGLCHRMALTPCSCARRPGSGAASSQRGYPQQQLPGGWEGRERKVSFLPIPFQPCVLGKEPCPPCFLKTKWRRRGGNNLLFDFWMVSAECSQRRMSSVNAENLFTVLAFLIFFLPTIPAPCKYGWDSKEVTGSSPLLPIESVQK